MSSNNKPYDDGVGFMGGLVRTSIAGGIIYGGVKFIRDEEGFRSGITSVVNRVMPTVERSSSVADTQIMNARQKGLEGFSFARKVSSILRDNRVAVASEAASSITPVNMTVTGLSATPKMAKRAAVFNFRGPADVRDALGNSIGETAIDALSGMEKFGLKFDRSSVRWEGTNLVASVSDAEKGFSHDLKIPFSAYDKETGSWLSKTGKRYDVVPKARLVSVERGVGVGAVLVDENSHIVQTLSDPKRLMHAAMQDEKFADRMRASHARVSSRDTSFADIKKYIEHVASKMSQGQIVNEVSMTEAVRAAMRTVKKGHDIASISSPENVRRFGSVIKTDTYSAELINDARPGYYAPQLTTTPFSLSPGQEPSILEENLRMRMTLGDRARRDPSLISVGAVKKVNGNIVLEELSIGETVKRGGPLKNFFSKAVSRLRQASGQEATSEGTWTVRTAHTLSHLSTEGYKSEKGYRLTRGVWGRPFTAPGATQPHAGAIMTMDVLDRIRHAPQFINKAELGKSGVENLVKNAISEKGIFNALMVVNPFDSDMIALRPDVARGVRGGPGALKASIPFNISVDSLVADSAGESVAEMQTFQDGRWITDIVDGGKRKVPIHQVYSDEKIREELMRDANKRAFIKKNSAIGISRSAVPVSDSATMQELISHDGRVVRVNADFIVNGSAIENFLAQNSMSERGLATYIANNGSAPQLQLFAHMENDTYKFGVGGGSTRSASHIVRINKGLAGLEKLGSPNIQAEGMMSADLFKSVWPNGKLGQVSIEKGGQEYLSFLQSSVTAHLMGYSEQGILAQGRFGKRIASYIAGNPRYVSDGSLNLTGTAMTGNMQWMQHLEDPKKLARQIEDTTALLGIVREHVTSNATAHLLIDDTRVASTGAQLAGKLGEDWDHIGNIGKYWDMAGYIDKPAEYLGGKELTDFLEVKQLRDRFQAGTLTQAEARRATFYTMGGLMPQEIPNIAQGKGVFNEMRIGAKDVHFFQNKGDIWRELTAQSSTDSPELYTQAQLMMKNLGGEGSRFVEGLKGYAATNGMEEGFHVLGLEKLQQMLGGVEGYGGSGMNNIKQLHMLHSTLFSENMNKHGFVVNSKVGPLYVPGAKLLGEGTFIPESGKLTFTDFGMDTFRMLREAAGGNGVVSEEAARKYMSSAMSFLGSTKRGALRMASTTVRNSIYAKHVNDVDFLNKQSLLDTLGLLSKGDSDLARNADELTNVLGDTIKMSHVDFKNSVAQYVRDAVTIAEAKPAEYSGFSSVLDEMLGKNNILTGEYKAIKSKLVKAEEGKTNAAIVDWAEAYTEKHVERSAKLQKEVSEFVTRGHYSSDEAGRLLKKLNNRSLAGIGVRYPSIFGASYSAGLVLVSKELKERTIAMGDKMRLNMNADIDGDNIMFKWLLSKGSRKETVELIDKHQRHTAEFMKLAKKKSLFDAITKGGGSFIESRMGGMTEEAAKILIKDMPISTAIAATFTKSLTGAFNIKALDTKGYMATMIRAKDLSESELSKVSAFFGTVTSRITEQEVISSKHLRHIIGGGGKIENVTSLMNRLTPDTIRQAVAGAEGGLHPLVLTAAIKGKGTHTYGAVYDQVANMLDLQLNTRSLGEGEFKNAMSLMYNDSTKLNDAWGKYQTLLSNADAKPIFERPEFEKAGLKGKRMLDLIAESFTEKHGGGNNASENIDTIIGKAIRLAGGTPEEQFKYIFKNMHLENYNLKVMNEMMVVKELWDATAKRQFVGRQYLDKAMSWLFEEGKAGGRIGTVAAIGFAAMTALNLLSGDGTPSDPNDIPSVNNPAFHSGGSGYGGTKTMYSASNYNSSVGLLSSSNLSFDSAMGQVSSLVNNQGYNRVAVRHDGTDPYKYQMNKYSR